MFASHSELVSTQSNLKVRVLFDQNKFIMLKFEFSRVKIEEEKQSQNDWVKNKNLQ